MKAEELLTFLRLAAALKGAPRHCVTLAGTPESVAAHAWRLALLAWLLREEQTDIDMDHVIEMALVHDLGEAVTGDIPSFLKTEAHEQTERLALSDIAALLPSPRGEALAALFDEWEAGQTREARFCRALDKLEAVISHNESDLSSWIPIEYELNLTYGAPQAEEFPFLKALRERMRCDTEAKIAEGRDTH